MFPKSLMKRITGLLLTFSLVVALVPAPAARAASTIRVSATGTTSWPCGDAWSNACTLQTALANATNGDEIWVGKGVHKPTTSTTDRSATFQLVSGVAIYGGFALTETLRTQRDPAANIVVLSGDIDNNDVVDAQGVVATAANIRGANSYHVVTGATGATLDGVTITAGNANRPILSDRYGGGMYNYSSSPTLTNVTFSGNTATQYGGGMYNYSSSPTLTNVTFSGNTATQYGGGMYNYISSSPTLTNVTFSSNAASLGGGMYNNEDSSPTLSNITFSGNAALSGGGMYNYISSSPTLTNVTFSGNTATQYGGGMYNYSSSPALTNVTFSSNAASSGGGMYNYYISSPTLTNVTFSGNTAATYGGGMYNYSSSSPTLTNVTFSGNAAKSGGGMSNDSHSSPTLTDVTFSGNTATQYGGGMYNYSSSPALTNVTFSGNTATQYGGGMYNYSSSPALTNVTFSSNAASSGGGMYNEYYSSPTLMNVTFSGNSDGGMLNYYFSSPTLTNVTFSGNSGGGMNNLTSSPTLTNATFSGNAATYGGGMRNDHSSSPTLTNVTFSGNTATHFGGGMCSGDHSSPTLTNVTFSGNTAGTYGGGMYSAGGTGNASSSPTLTNVTFSGNAAPSGGGIYNDVFSTLQVQNTLFWGDNGGEIYNYSLGTAVISDSVVQGGCPSGITCTHIISADPLLAPLGSYGGSTPTRALLPGSPAIDATNTNCPATDQRGVTRGSTCDIGAFESQGFTLGALTGTPQSAIHNTVFAQPLGMSVTSAFSEPVAGGVIAFTAPTSGAGLVGVTPFTKTIGASGTVSATVTANGLTGSYTVTASASGATSVNFALTNLGQTLYARSDGATSGACTTWASACVLQYALTQTTARDEIWVGKGVYKPTATTTDRTATFQLVSGVAVYGGFGMTETLRTQRDPAVNVVVLSGDIDHNDGVDARGVVTTSVNLTGTNSYHVVKGVDGAMLDGVTITAGNAKGDHPNDFGGGMYNYSTSPTLSNVTFSGNAATFGGGIGNVSSSPTLTNVTFSGNAATYSGGGMYNDYNSSPMLSNVTFSDNVATNNGGGMFNQNSSSPTLSSVTFSGNTATYGGGIYNYSSSPTLTNVTFSGNTAAQYGGGMYNHWYSGPTLTNVTFSGNSATSGSGGGMVNWDNSNPQVRNTLLWGDSGGEIYNANSTSTVSNSVVQGGCPSDSTCINVISADPRLASLGNFGGSMRIHALLPGSAAINATSTNCPATDQRGVTRGSTCDIGAFESQGFTLGTLTGTPQSTIINTAFAQPLGLSVTSAFDEPVAGGVISFTAPTSGASLAGVTPFTKTISASGAVSATVTTNGLTGSYTVTASANGAASVNFALANKLATTTTLTSAPNPSVFGQAVTFTAAVTATVGIPTGSVIFYDNSVNLGSGTLDASGQATLTTASLIAGTQPITATYGGDANYHVSTSSVDMQTVNQAPATIMLGNLNQTYDGTTKPVTSTTSPLGLMIVVTYTGISGTTYGPSTTAPTTAGTYQVDAAINDVNYQGTATGTLIIHLANTTTSVTSSPNPSTYGQAVTFTATVTSSGGTPTGSITFTFDATNLTVPLGANGQAVYVTQTLALGNHPVSAAYSGDANFNVSSGVLSGGQVVTDVPITNLTAVNSSPTRLTDATLFTATINAGSNVTYQWAFGDGQTASGALSSHTYAAAGNYTAIVTATNGAGSVSTVTPVTITNQRPVANAGIDQSVPVNAVVTLAGSGSIDPDEHLPLMYRWAQSGGPSVTFTPNVSVTSFTAPSAPTVLTFTLMVTDAFGLNSTPGQVVVLVAEQAITDLLAINNSPTSIGRSTFFTATIGTGSNALYVWDFGDGQTGSGAQVSHRYMLTGTYTATVTATNGAGSINATMLVTIEPVKLYLPLVLRR